MKIAITGGTAGIGQAVGNVYESLGHDVVRLSRRTGHNIRNIEKCAQAIEDSDLFVNNAQEGYSQTDLLFEMFKRWLGQKKTIVVISSVMASRPVTTLEGFDEYWLQKRTLEEAVSQLRNKSHWPRIILVRPGGVATQPGQDQLPNYSNVNEWAEFMVNALMLGQGKFVITDLTFGIDHCGQQKLSN